MKYLSFLIKPASSLCNLRCRYCFYHDVSEQREQKSYGIMEEAIMKQLIQKAFACLDEDGQVTFAFQGGEPTVAGLPFFRSFCAEVKQYKKKTQTVHYAIQTNGIVLDDAWGAFLKEEQFLVGVSLDGYESNTDFFRYDARKKGAYRSIMKGIHVLQKYQVDFNILTVLTSKLAKHPKALYEYYKEQKFNYVQLIPCLPSLDVNELQDEYRLTPHDFANFYKVFYDLWLKDYQKGKYMSVTLFDNVIPMFADIPPQQCGMLGFCSAQLVVEGNGSVYPCDFYVLDEYACGNISEQSVMEILEHQNMKKFLKEKKRIGEACSTCPFYRVCRSGCKRQNIVYFDEDDTYCGYQDFLQHAAYSMMQIAKQLR